MNHFIKFSTIKKHYNRQHNCVCVVLSCPHHTHILHNVHGPWNWNLFPNRTKKKFDLKSVKFAINTSYIDDDIIVHLYRLLCIHTHIFTWEFVKLFVCYLAMHLFVKHPHRNQCIIQFVVFHSHSVRGVLPLCPFEHEHAIVDLLNIQHTKKKYTYTQQHV